IRNAGVQLNPLGTKTVTGSEGQYEFTELKAGEYTLQVTKTGYADLVNYSMKVEAGKTAKGDVQIEKLPAALRVLNANGHDIDTLNFGTEQDVVTRSFSIFNDSPESLEWLIEENCLWITTISKTFGTLQAGKQQPISITIDREKLSGGNNNTILNITSDNGNKELSIRANLISDIILQEQGIAVQNTDISSDNINWNNAKEQCENSIVSGYTNWRLPTIAELTAIYNNKHIINGLKYDEYYVDNEEVKQWTWYYYWTSNTEDEGTAYVISMTNGWQLSLLKQCSSLNVYLNVIISPRCRCVRSLP
ncbi:MAG: DUF1566 domain-containing protein, partial [Bacteroidales bacterium]|nr:DUF1566 domain-containing protein [Bacteroidales bacterium]